MTRRLGFHFCNLNSDFCNPCSYFFSHISEEVCLDPLGGFVIEAFADQHRIAAHFDHHRALFGHPGVAAAQGPP